MHIITFIFSVQLYRHNNKKYNKLPVKKAIIPRPIFAFINVNVFPFQLDFSKVYPNKINIQQAAK